MKSKPHDSGNLSVSKNGPQGSSYDRSKKRKRHRKPLRRFRKFLGAKLTDLACYVLPALYLTYLKLVSRTSQVSGHQSNPFQTFVREGQSLVNVLWHQDAFLMPYFLRDFRFSALASTGTLGRIVSVLMEALNMQVFRGGRKRHYILRDMIHYMSSNDAVLYGLTVDGSKGPPRVLKQGACRIARNCGKAVFITHTQAKYNIYLPTWDRLAIPLPFNRIVTSAVGPYWIEPNSSRERFQQFCQHIEQEMLELTFHTDGKLHECAGKSSVTKDFPSNWNGPLWENHQMGRAFSEWDLQSDRMPPWTSVNSSEARVVGT